MRAVLLALLLAALGGCTLIDQRTFNPEAGAPPVVPKPPVPAPQPDRMLDGTVPFVGFRAGQDTGYDAAVAQAVAAALARKRDAQFTVLTAVPPGTADSEAAAVAAVAPEAARVASLIIRGGVPGRARAVAGALRAEPRGARAAHLCPLASRRGTSGAPGCSCSSRRR